MRLTHVGARSEDTVVGRSEADTEERGTEEQEQSDHRCGHGQRPAHHEHGNTVPDALAVDDWAALEHATLLDTMTEGGEQRRQQDDGTERRSRRHASAYGPIPAGTFPSGVAPEENSVPMTSVVATT